MVRVISGEAKGHTLKGPPSFSTRPMADKIRQSLFSALGSLGVEPVRVLDLFAGTGAIGIEALSRGAAWADFVDHNPAACAVVRANLAHTKLAGRAQVHQGAVQPFLARSGEPYDFVVLDPPYADAEIEATLEKVAASSLVQSGTIVVIGHWPRLALPEEIGRMTRIRERCHGDSCYSIFEVDLPDGGEDDR